MAQPDPNQEPTVAQFSMPAGAAAPAAPATGSPPGMSPSAFSRVMHAAPDLANAVEAARNGQVPDPATVMRVMQSMGVRVAGAPAEGSVATGPSAPAAAPRQPRPAGQQIPVPAPQKPHFRDVLNELGDRIHTFLLEQLPGVDIGMTFRLDDNGSPEIRMAAYIPRGEDEPPYVLAENVADGDAFGDVLYHVVAAAQKKVEEEAPPEEPEVDTEHLGGDY